MEDLKGHQLVNFPTMLFGGADEKLSAGSWVSENHQTFTRTSKFTSMFLVCNVEDDLLGAGNTSRVNVAFVALVARLMTHAGVDERVIDETRLVMKEHMSSV